MKRFLSKSEVRDKVKLSHTQIARLEAAGKFPKRIALGTHRTSRRVWLESDVDAWMEGQIQRARPA
jgi:prophage regulatory protein